MSMPIWIGLSGTIVFCRDGKVLRNMLRRMVGVGRGVVQMKPEYFKFCFVREPLKWYESYWRFMQSQNWPQMGDSRNPYQWHPDSMLRGLGSSDFNAFVANVNKARPGFVTEMYGWYVRPGMNFVGKQETLVEDLKHVLFLQGLDVDLHKLQLIEPQNETPAEIPRPEWDFKLKKETLRLEYAGYVRFGYSAKDALRQAC